MHGAGRSGAARRAAIDPVAVIANFGTVTLAVLLDHTIGAQHNNVRYLDAERLRGLHVDDHFKLGRLLDGQIAGLRALKYFVRMGSDTPIQVKGIRAI